MANVLYSLHSTGSSFIDAISLPTDQKKAERKLLIYKVYIFQVLPAANHVERSIYGCVCVCDPNVSSCMHVNRFIRLNKRVGSRKARLKTFFGMHAFCMQNSIRVPRQETHTHTHRETRI